MSRSSQREARLAMAAVASSAIDASGISHATCGRPISIPPLWAIGATSFPVHLPGPSPTAREGILQASLPISAAIEGRVTVHLT